MPFILEDSCLSKDLLDFADMSENVCMLESLFVRFVSGQPLGCGRSWSEGDCNLERGTSRVGHEFAR